MLSKKCVIYARVSTYSQNVYNKNISMDVQEMICSQFANENKLQVKSVYKEVHSAYNKTPCILNDIINKKNQTIIIAGVDRYSRSIDIGLSLAKQSVNNNNILIFVNEDIICKKKDDIHLILPYLQQSQNESYTIGKRIHTSKQYLINNGMYSGGSIPYGYDVVDKKLVENNEEQNIIKFIRYCRQSRVYPKKLNQLMRVITKQRPYIPIKCYNNYDNKVLPYMSQSISYTDIARILNSYDIKKRNKRWSLQLVKRALNIPSSVLNASHATNTYTYNKVLNKRHNRKIKSNVNTIINNTPELQIQDNSIEQEALKKINEFQMFKKYISLFKNKI